MRRAVFFDRDGGNGDCELVNNRYCIQLARCDVSAVEDVSRVHA